MVLVKNPDRHLEKYLKDHEYDYVNYSDKTHINDVKIIKTKKTKKERTPEQIESDKLKMANIRAKRQVKTAVIMKDKK